ncbi:MAG: alcohol dehydrogenase catalytic domain-containing protein [Gemmatimonadota bacterium]
MRAVVFGVTVPGFLLARSVGRVSRSATHGVLSGLRLRDWPEPVLPGPDWVKLSVLYGGICGSDLGNLSFTSSPLMEPFGSFPAVLGHEIVARVDEVGSAVTRVRPGDRVAVDPMLSCGVRGFTGTEVCGSCAVGRHSTCGNAGEEGRTLVDGTPLARGLTIGYHADLPGGWGERMIAHESQLFPVDEAIDDRVAALIEPLSIGMHAVLNTPVGSGPVLVIGSGPIAFATIWALRAAGYGGELVAQAKRAPEVELARALGASSVVRPGDEARDALIATGAQAYQPIVGPEVYAGGGFPVIFDCVGSGATLAQSLSYASARGRVVMLGCVAEIKKVDLTLLWAHELEVHGFVGYGAEQWRGEVLHTFEVTQRLLLESAAPVQRMVTDVYPLKQVREALAAAEDRRTSGAIKVLLQP